MSSSAFGVSSVQLWVMVATLLLLAKFAIGSIGPWIFSSRRLIAPLVRLLHVLNHYAVIYTLGLMQPSSSHHADDPSVPSVAEFLQVWAVLIVTMQDSVSIGRPYKTKEMTLIDLLSSVWSANQIRVRTRARLAAPLWIIWCIHASRVVWHYVSTIRATNASLDNVKLVSDYMMTSQHTDDDDACPSTMRGYRYIVVWEDEQMMEVSGPPGFTLEMKLTGPKAAQLLTVDKVWEQAQDKDDRLLSRTADRDNMFKDVCLSFALYKLQRRRFYNFPVAEAAHPATRRLVSDAILEEGADGTYERALRITEVELSFLHASFYSRHAVVFSGGFPWVQLALSLLVTVAALYLACAVGDIPSTGNIVAGKRERVVRITHGALFTYLVIAIVVCRELGEVSIYVLSQWTKVWIICHYIKLKGCQGRIKAARQLMMEMVARIMFRVIRGGQWGRQIRQHNLLARPSTLAQFAWPLILRKVKLQREAKRVLFQSLKTLIDTPLPSPEPSAQQQMMNSLLMSYSRSAFPIPAGPAQSHSKLPVIEGTASDLEGETHKILVWHIATSLCQMKILDEAGERGADLYTLPKSPFTGDLAAVTPHYITAVSLSNYCAYLVTQGLVPDNGLVANKVFHAVSDEVRDALRGCSTMTEIRNKLTVTPENGAATTILGMGAQLSEKLMSLYKRDDELWERLGRFWAGFLLHLSASTRAAKHRIHLQGRGELTTLLWVLLSHAGFLGNTSHGEQLLDPEDLNDVC
ncbi:hypothetical protein SETIT_8G050100v2 [Setaria italica]|uniref:DUF4220 domain-containing protein n=1 Tax=Setaria italica TaxID=4555 RepID=K3ZHG6_SETIT|nr:uncharacterized protein LOC101766871 [Setaria italica]XP_004978816.1 uncharacterized protein LOC101766871 [Setaria italica]XP_004978817.1 uncharacterized protein LOC101766871 [Setaria italica]RCV37281.1 hypothetical protein SETIT_8G050100v2 [Setaria italica]RCV37282.1 hypothetical protein SETIT_8G050100v2 [Setaria italica]RCV37283.1 hypothetical protein SETIT_8G050100v2 [Setaria italica]